MIHDPQSTGAWPARRSHTHLGGSGAGAGAGDGDGDGGPRNRAIVVRPENLGWQQSNPILASYSCTSVCLHKAAAQDTSAEYIPGGAGSRSCCPGGTWRWRPCGIGWRRGGGRGFASAYWWGGGSQRPDRRKGETIAVFCPGCGLGSGCWAASLLASQQQYTASRNWHGALSIRALKNISPSDSINAFASKTHTMTENDSTPMAPSHTVRANCRAEGCRPDPVQPRRNVAATATDAWHFIKPDVWMPDNRP
jgi:hypothetical protein